jgi:hypothetical protein
MQLYKLEGPFGVELLGVGLVEDRYPQIAFSGIFDSIISITFKVSDMILTLSKYEEPEPEQKKTV